MNSLVIFNPYILYHVIIFYIKPYKCINFFFTIFKHEMLQYYWTQDLLYQT